MKQKFTFLLALLCTVWIGAKAQTEVGTAEALKTALTAGGSVKLTDDITLAETLTSANDVTIDLNGHNIIANGARAIWQTEGTLTLAGKGTISDENISEDSKSIIRVGDNNGTAAGIVVGANVTVSSQCCYAITYFGKDAQTVTISGTVTSSKAAALSGNGSAGLGATTVTINEGAVVTSTADCAIYHPETGTMTVNGGTITGLTGIEVRAGELVVNGGTINATSTSYTCTANNNGSTTKGAAIAVAQHTTMFDVNVTVKGGTFSGVNGLTVMNPQANTSSNVTVNVEGGKFTASNVGVVAQHGTTNLGGSVEITAVEGAIITGKGTGATINVTGGTYTAKDNAVIAGNGSSRDGEANTINISGGVFNGQIKTAGYVACGIYAPWKDNITVSGGTFNITNGCGICQRAGNVTVTGGTFNCTGTATGKVGDSRVVVPCSAIVYDSQAAYPAMSDDSKVTVTAGTFNTDASVAPVTVVAADGETAKRAQVSGGTFSGVVDEAYCADNFSNAVAKIGDTEYASLAAAVKAVNDGETITLLADIDDASNYLLINNGKTFTLDLNGKTLKQKYIDLYNAFITIKNGTYVGSMYENTSATDAAYNSLTLAKDATIDANTGYGIIVYQNSVGANNFGSTLNVYGTIKNAVAGIWVMGNITTDLATAANPVKINVSGTITADQDESVGIAESGSAILNIAEGANITGSTAVEVRAGSINVTGGTLTATGDFTSNPNANGTTTTGVALAVAQHTTKVDISANITGGTFTGAKALYESNPQENDPKPQVDMTVSAGTFKGEVSTADVTNFISGGSFSSAVPASYCALGYQPATTADANTGMFKVDAIIYALTAYAGSETSQSITTIAEWNALLAQNPNAIATAEDNETNEALANGSKNIVLLSNSGNVCPNFVLTDPATGSIGAAANFITPVAFTATAGSYTRSLRANGNAICVPFALSGTDEFKLQSFKEKGSDVVYFQETASVDAGVPCILYSPEAQTYTWEFQNTSIVASPSNGSAMEGTFTANTSYNGNTNYYGMLDNGQEFGLAPVTLYPFRSILYLGGENAKARRIVFLGIDDDETAISSISSDASAKKDIYTINGVKVSEVKRPGLYIINGKKTFVK